MSYQVLARKWRPQDFEHLIGQESIVAALKNALRENRIAQAYVFSGIRGVGKTTAARVLAKALNCEQGPTPEPCNACVACREITAGSDLDVIEIDAATYSKVEQIRELTESLRYGPARDRFKVVVLDEVHRLSRQAFDALLKIVEEPPPGLVFIFATTEIEAVPATILSRCQEYAFRRVPVTTLVAHLRTIAAAEKITASDSALRLIARAGEGSVRDSVALLDQLATFGGGEIAEESAARLVGGMDTALFRELLPAILAGQSPAVAAAAAKVEEQGWDPRQVYAHFLTYCRAALHLALDRGAEALDLGPDEGAELAALARKHGYEPVLRLLHYLLQSEAAIRRSEVGVLALEIAWLRAAELPKLIRIEAALAGPVAPIVAAEPSAPKPPTEASRKDGRPDAPTPPPRPVPVASAPAPVSSAATPPDEAPAPRAPLSESAQRLIDAINKRRPALAARLSHAADIHAEGNVVSIAIPASDTDTAETLRRPATRAVLDEAVADGWGAGATWSVVNGAAAPKSSDGKPSRSSSSEARSPGSRTEAKSTPPEVPATVAEHPTVQAVLEIFNGRVAEVVARPPKGDGA
jgi:DNA polymerase-3 subunit gamma/tau